MTLTAIYFSMLRSALCVVVLAICLVTSQCTASTPEVVPPATGAPADAPAGGTSTGGEEVKGDKVDKKEEGGDEDEKETEGVEEGHDAVSLTGSSTLNSGSSSGSVGTQRVDGGRSSVGTVSVSGSGTMRGTVSGVNPLNTASDAVTPSGQEQVPLTDASGSSPGPKGDVPAAQNPTTERATATKPTRSQMSLPDTSVQKLKSTTSTAAPTDSTQTSVTSTTESPKGESAAPETSLPKLSKTLQSVDKKDSSVASLTLFGFTTLFTLTVMAVAPEF